MKDNSLVFLFWWVIFFTSVGFAQQQDTASWYSRTDANIHRFTASGEVFDDRKSTCASWDFPFGTYLKVTNLKNGKSVVCKVNDRGPAKHLRRHIDLTKTAFRQIADPRIGLAKVRVVPLGMRK